MVSEFYEWLSEQPNPENVSITDVLLYHILLELRKGSYSTTGGQPTLPLTAIAEAVEEMKADRELPRSERKLDDPKFITKRIKDETGRKSGW